jgi:hypothetical protein
MLSKLVGRVARLVTLTLCTASAAASQAVGFSGYTTGCFGAACVPPTANVFQTAGVGGVTYENATFAGTTSGGTALLNGAANALGTRDVNNLGAVYLTSQLAEYTGTPFTLAVTFGTPGVGTLTIPATLVGFVRAGSEVSGVTFDFDNTPRSLAFSSGGSTGLLTLTVSDAFVDAPLGSAVFAVPVQGRVIVTLAAVPEPSTQALLATGLALGAILAWRATRGA